MEGSLEKQREKARNRQKQRRESLTDEERQKINAKRREQYARRKLIESDEQANLRRSKDRDSHKKRRFDESSESAEQRRSKDLESKRSRLANESEEQATQRRCKDRDSHKQRRVNESLESAEQRRFKDLESKHNRLANESEEQATQRRSKDRDSHKKRRANESPVSAEQRRSKNLESNRNRLANQSEEQSTERRSKDQDSHKKRRANESPESAKQRRSKNLESNRNRLANESEEQAAQRRFKDRDSHKKRRANESPESAEQRRILARETVRNNYTINQYILRIWSLANTPCMICHKVFYQNQVHRVPTATLPESVRNYLPPELLTKDILIVCNRHKTHLKDARRNMPSSAYWNNMDLSPIPNELKCLSFYERRLLSRVFLYQNFINLIPSHRERYWDMPVLKGQVIHFHQDVHEVPAQLLPRPPNECGLVVITSHLDSINKVYELKVDFQRLVAALNWLKINNPCYRDVTINYSQNVDVTQIVRVPHIDAPEQQNLWRPLNTNSHILNGNMHQGRESIFGEWAGKQCVAMCVVACLKSKIVQFNSWTSNTISEVLLAGTTISPFAALVGKYSTNNLYTYLLLAGNRYYKNILDMLESVPRHLLVNELSKEPLISLGKKFQIDFASDPEFYGIATKSSLLSELTRFFANYESGIIIDSLEFARLIQTQVCDEAQSYYVFDSHSCTKTGRKSKSEARGAACVMKFNSIEALCNNLSSRMENSGQFTLDRINITIRSDMEISESEPELEQTSSIEIQTALYHTLMLPDDRNQPQVSDIVDVQESEQVNVNEIHRKTDAPINVFHEPKAEEMAWFHLFPFGVNGLNEPREQAISPLEYFQTRLMNKDTRFQSAEYITYALSMFELLRTRSNINVCAKKIRQQGRMVEDLHLYVKNLRGSGAYFTDCTKELMAMITQLGPPSFFLSFSSDDLHWPDLRYALLVADQRPDVNPFSLTPQETQELIEKYPVVVMRHFQNQFLALLQLILHDQSLFGGKVIDYWWRIEFQNRGAPHIHMVIWVENFPSLEETDPDRKRELMQRLHSIVTCHLPDEQEDPELRELVDRCQVHHHTRSCYKKSNHCRFGFPRQTASETTILNITTENVETMVRNGGRICILKRNESEKNVNNYHPALLRLWRANMDIQPCGTAIAIAYYIAKYVAKPEPLHFETTLRDAIRNIRQTETDPLKKLYRIINEMLNRRLVSLLECVLRLLNLKYKMSSRKSVFLNSRKPEKRYNVIRLGRESNGNELCETLFDRYMKRPDDLENWSLLKLAMWYEVIYANRVTNVDHDEGDDDAFNDDFLQIRRTQQITLKDGRTKMKKRSKEAIITTPVFSISRDPEAYFYHLLLLNKPFRDESELLEGHNTCAAAFEANREQLQVAIDELRPYRHIAHELEVAIEHIQLFENIEIPQLDQELETDFPEENNETTGIDDNLYNQAQSSLNVDQRRLFQFVSRQVQKEVMGVESSPIRLFVTGSAGTGKSHILKLVAEHIRRGYRILHPNESHCYVKVCAYTGVAALLIGGQTLHSVFKFSVQKGRTLPAYKQLTGIWLERMRQFWKHTRFLIIDEISMVPYEILYQIHRRLQELKCNYNDLFGGVNILLFGDLMQLPPVMGSPVFIQPDQMEGSLHLFQQFSFCELKEIVRQKGDSTFVDLLNNLREGSLTTEQYELLVSKAENSKQENAFALGEALRIVPTVKMVEDHNQLVIKNVNPSIEKFEIIAQDRLIEHDMRAINVPIERVIPTNINKTAGVPRTLLLYKGLRVMLRYNVDISRGLVNGTMGTIVNIQFSGWRRQQLHDHDIPKVTIKIARSNKEDQEEIIEPITVNFDANFGYGTVERRMLPMVPCYAVTVHKLQGSTINKAVINLGNKYFAPGQKFVALSRCTSLAGIEIDEICPNGLLEGNVCNEDALEEMYRLRTLPPYDGAVINL